MAHDLVQFEMAGRVATLTLSDPAKRNALSSAMFDALEARLRGIQDESTASVRSEHVLRLRAAGKAFCSGFDLSAVVEEPALLESFILRLSDLTRTLRRLPMIVIAEVHGAALAGGCALVSACDLVIAAPSATFGYPVHALGISPAVTIPTLMPRTGEGPARALLLGGEIISTAQAESIGLVTRVSASDATLVSEADALCDTIAGHGANALRATKDWLNQLDSSLDDARFDGPAQSSARAAMHPNAVAQLRDAWQKRSPPRTPGRG